MKKVYIVGCNEFPIMVLTNRKKALYQYELLKSQVESGSYYMNDQRPIETYEFVVQPDNKKFVAYVNDQQRDIYYYVERWINEGTFNS